MGTTGSKKNDVQGGQHREDLWSRSAASSFESSQAVCRATVMGTDEAGLNSSPTLAISPGSPETFVDWLTPHV